jgi:hypothetical protein
MELYGLTVKSLAEMEPKWEGKALGYNRGGHIRLYLGRPFGLIVDCMLHELVHNIQGAHNFRFWR